mmetsp:Transcript_39087/g.58715  ORF Transcript_39087/g.58715 Transcript_39087/m.58715 type:complete len:188 (+) Transcript_39087:3519-4082(+)
MIANDTTSSMGTHQQRMNFKVELACETFSIPELKMDLVHDVHSLLILYDDDNDYGENEQQQIKDEGKKGNDKEQSNTLSSYIIHPINTHPDDAVSDLKRIILSKYSKLWGLDGRDTDRDGIAMGWELVIPTKETLDHVSLNFDENDNEKDTKDEEKNEILGNHWFLHSYDVHHGDIIYAVVRKKEFW